jgi:hypothetical protein
MNSSEEQNNHNIADNMNNSTVEHKTATFTSNNFNGVNNLEKVRDILFGQQIREHDQKFTNLETLISQECTKLREETKQRLDLLENYLKTEIDSLIERVKNERAEREYSINDLAAEQKKIFTSWETKFSQLDEQTSNSQRELREQVLSQSKKIQDEIQRKSEEILALLQKESQELRHDKIDNSHLASMFTELAFRLSNKQ